MDLAVTSGTTGRGRGPERVRTDGRRVDRTVGQARLRGSAWRWPMVRIPSACSSFAITRPTPHSRSTGSGARNADSSPEGTTTRPSGFPRSDATFATNLFDASPADAVSPVSAWIRVLIRRTVSTGSPNSDSVPVRSRERLVHRDLLHERREGREELHDLGGDPLVASACRRAETPRGGTVAPPGRWAWPSERQTVAPRRKPLTPHLVPGGRRQR